ncbi:hypothetical protein HK097_009411 [Rhizophlyctis rosea]|uniref:DUF7886 domain-containing protein n=1 Tax=Rhizophlyctis rosea TaxID=64517 RepID=A0AAD5SPN8_9FUNG|nr:hypothetical protein HK097_009411 [Rhizophlyctis rosea]
MFDLIDELVTLILQPPPFNPFSVDRQYFTTLTPEESVVRIAATVDFLNQVYATDHVYADEVLQDIKYLQAKQFKDLSHLAR